MLYSQDVLRSLSFINRGSEPAMETRSISVRVSGLNDSQSCNILVSISLVNDNPPVVDLNGPLQPSINYSTALNYSFIRQNSVWIAARDATISDFDADGRTELVEINLIPGYPGDGIILSERVGCPIDNSSVCHIRLVVILVNSLCSFY